MKDLKEIILTDGRKAYIKAIPEKEEKAEEGEKQDEEKAEEGEKQYKNKNKKYERKNK